MKKYLMILVAMVCFGISAYATCVSAKLEYNEYSETYTVYLKNACDEAKNVTISYYEKESGKWIPKTVYIAGHDSNSICIYSSTQYKIVKEVPYQ
jgi:hypothetical protein